MTSQGIAWKCYLAEQTEKWDNMSPEERHSYERKYNYEHLDEVAECFGGVLKAYLDCTDSDRKNLPPKLYQLVNYINNRQVPPDDLIKYACSPCLWIGMTMTSSDIKYACQHSLTNYIKWLDPHRSINPHEMFIDACYNNQPAIIQLISTHYSCDGHDEIEYIVGKVDQRLLLEICMEGYLEVAQLIRPYFNYMNNCTYLHSAFYTVCQNCETEMVKWMIEQWPALLDIADVFCVACAANRLDTAQYLLTVQEISEDTWDEALDYTCRNGHTNMAKWLLSNHQYDISNNYIETAGRFNHSQVVELLYEHGLYQLDNISSVFNKICGCGRFQLARRLYQLFPTIEPDLNRVWTYITEHGDDEMVVWYLQTFPNNSRMFERPIVILCSKCSLETVQLFYQLYPDTSTSFHLFSQVCKAGNLAVAKFILQQTNFKNLPERVADLTKVRQTNTECSLYNYKAEYVITRINDISDLINDCIKLGHVEIANWLREFLPCLDPDITTKQLITLPFYTTTLDCTFEEINCYQYFASDILDTDIGVKQLEYKNNYCDQLNLLYSHGIELNDQDKKTLEQHMQRSKYGKCELLTLNDQTLHLHFCFTNAKQEMTYYKRVNSNGRRISGRIPYTQQPYPRTGFKTS